MLDYINDGMLRMFTCKDCGAKWHGYDAGDSICEKCGSYSTKAELVRKDDKDG